MNILEEIPLYLLAPSPTNPRKHFDETKLGELAQSIRQHGILEPILVRADGKSAQAGYEVVAGERRYRASLLAEIETVPCIVREMTDREVLEIQVIENLQRDDLHPLEEAQGYSALMKQAGYDVEEIAGRIGRSKKYVYDRVKLLQLIPELREPFLAGEITAGHAVLLARLPSDDQKRALGRDVHASGVFDIEIADTTLFEEGQKRRKAKSVRELQTWIDHNVRFRPDDVDLPNLFPETAEQLRTAAEEELKIVKITREYRVPDAAKDPKERTYGSAHWKRADGAAWRPDSWGSRQVISRTCEHSRLGVVVAGPGRGESFLVCVDKKKCDVHWLKERNERAKAGQEDARASEQQRQSAWEEKRKQQEAERARWQKAAPQLLEALAGALQETPALDLVDTIVERCKPWHDVPTQMERGETLEEAVRYAAFLDISRCISDTWNAPTEAPKALKRYGINAKKIVDEVDPKPKAPKKKAARTRSADVSTPDAQAAEVVS